MRLWSTHVRGHNISFKISLDIIIIIIIISNIMAITMTIKIN